MEECFFLCIPHFFFGLVYIMYALGTFNTIGLPIKKKCLRKSRRASNTLRPIERKAAMTRFSLIPFYKSGFRVLRKGFWELMRLYWLRQ